jgi:uncharacterized protein YjbI with pentapeptide repeats
MTDANLERALLGDASFLNANLAGANLVNAAVELASSSAR